MPDPPQFPRGEHPSTYFVPDRENQEELERLRIQDQMITRTMGGVLPEQTDITPFRRVLDVACGTGGWLIELARQNPETMLIGIDVSKRMIDYAREQAIAAGVDERVEFHTMDALRMLEFPQAFFDLVNMRCGGSFMRTWDWPKLLSEMQRVTRSEGVIRLTEPEILHQSTSPALTRLCEMFQCAMFQAGHLFTEDTNGIIDHLARLLTQHGCQDVQTRDHFVQGQPGTEEGEAYIRDVRHFYRTIRPFLEKRGCASSDYDAVYQQALVEMQQPTFHATWHLRTAWGTMP
jgi:ubiquinone/menaquinone biosynthesis C-methylase UbiE